MLFDMDPRISRAHAKLGRARQHALELEGRMTAWHLNSPFQCRPSIAPDRLSWEVRVYVESAPPVSEWALIAGDAIHNARSALDALVWAFTDTDQLSRNEQQGVAYPIIADPNKWPQTQSAKLRTVPPSVADVIKKCQPFNRPESERGKDALSLLHRLDIQDKHRLPLEMHLGLNELRGGTTIEYHENEAADRNVPPDIRVNVDPFSNGMIFLSGRTLDPIRSISGSWSLTFRVSVDIGGTEPVPVLTLIKNMIEYSSQLIGVVEGAVTSSDSEPTS